MMKSYIVILSLLLLTGFYSCEREPLALSTTDDVNMLGYFEEHPDQFSEFTKILELTGYAGFMGAYGEYTCFAPTNEAIDQYLQEKGIASLEGADVNALKDLVEFHVLQDTLPTAVFTDGKLPVPTMYGQYLITTALFSEGVTRVRVNRQANIIESNIRTGNGLVHAIDHVLEPATLTLAQLVEEMPGYSIFTAALKETGWYDTLNVKYANEEEGRRQWFTLLAQSDSVYKSMGINDYQALKTKYSQTGNPEDPSDSLNLYVAYHCLGDLKYLADMVTALSHNTLAPKEVITVKRSGDTILINEDLFNGVLEKGSPVKRSKSDYSAFNGVLHTVASNFQIKVRLPFPVYWDVADQPELRLITNAFRVPGQGVNLSIGQLEDVTWEGGGPNGDVAYFTESPTGSNSYYYDDGLYVYLRSAVVKWIEFTTPLVVKGRYKIWVCTRRGGGGVYQAFFDGEPMPRTFDGRSYYPGLSDGDAEAQGWKQYTTVSKSTQYGRLLGTIDIETTDRHKIKFVTLDNTRGGVTIDMIHFIPADMEQLWPRFNRDGTWEDKPAEE